jgi:hypothetical protein
MELKVIHLLLILIGVIVLGYFGYKAREGFANTPAVNLSCVPTDVSGSILKESSKPSNPSKESSKPSNPSKDSGSANDSSVSMNNLLGLSGAPPTDNGSMAPYLPNIETVIRGEFVNHALNIPDTPIPTVASPVPTVASPVSPISNTQQIASLKASDANALQTIQKVVHNELLSQKGMTTGAQMAFLGEKKRKDRRNKREDNEDNEEEDDSNDSNDSNSSNSSNDSPSNHQGKEFTRDCPKNTGKPDMSKYIRKDSIPCWGCNVE